MSIEKLPESLQDPMESLRKGRKILKSWPQPKCVCCGTDIESGTEPEKDGTYWCPTCDQAGASPTC